MNTMEVIRNQTFEESEELLSAVLFLLNISTEKELFETILVTRLYYTFTGTSAQKSKKDPPFLSHSELQSKVNQLCLKGIPCKVHFELCFDFFLLSTLHNFDQQPLALSHCPWLAIQSVQKHGPCEMRPGVPTAMRSKRFQLGP